MTLTALVPSISRTRFTRERPGGLDPVFYEVIPPSRPARVLRRVQRAVRGGVSDVEVRVEFAASDDELARVQAFWMSDELSFTPGALGQLLDRLPALRWVYYQRSGVERLDADEFRQRGVALSNTGDLVSQWVAEMALACVVSHAKGLPDHIARQRMGRSSPILGAALGGQTVGVVGTGNIGREVTRLCRGLDMRVLGLSRDPGRFDDDAGGYHEVRQLPDDLDWLAGVVDHLVLAVPARPETRELIDAARLRRMKPSASLINVTRPQVTVETDLLAALSRGWLRAAYVERVVGLPARIYAMTFPTRLVITHGSAAHVPPKWDAAFNQFVAGAQTFAAGGEPPNRVV